MRRGVCHERVLKEFPCSHIAIRACIPHQPGPVGRKDVLFDALKDLLSVLGELTKIVNEIDKQEFLAQRLWKRRLQAKIEHAPTQREPAVPLVIVDDGLVVELGRADAELLISVGRGQEETVVFQERLDQLVILGWSFSENGVLRTEVESSRQLHQRSIADKLLEMPVNSSRPREQILSPIDV